MQSCLKLAKWYGLGEPRRVPLKSLSLFATRDAMTMLASFTLVEPTATALTQHGVINNPKSAIYAAQLALPVSIQTISTPLHLLGLGESPNHKNFLVNFSHIGVIMIRFVQSACCKCWRKVGVHEKRVRQVARCSVCSNRLCF